MKAAVVPRCSRGRFQSIKQAANTLPVTWNAFIAVSGSF